MLRAFQPDLDALHFRQQLPSKTPARMLQTQSQLNGENRAGPYSVKGKRVALAPQTPGLNGGKNAPRTAGRGGALQDKTPFANRQISTPAAGKKQIQVAATPLQQIQERAPYSAESLPSATRTRLRMPRNMYETPAPNGNHWDISDGSIELSDTVGSLSLNTVPTAEEFDDIEYMPPRAITPEYEPPFDMPNYAQLGANLMSIAHLACFPDEAAYDPHNDFDGHTLLPPSPVRPNFLCENEELDDDSDLFPNVPRTPAGTSSLAVRKRLTSTSSRSTRLGVTVQPRITRTTPSSAAMSANLSSAVPYRAPSIMPSRPTAPTPGASRPVAPTPAASQGTKPLRTLGVVPLDRRAPAAGPAARRPAVPRLTHTRTASVPTVFQRPQNTAPSIVTRPSHGRSISSASAMSRLARTKVAPAAKRPAVEIVLKLPPILSETDGFDGFILRSGE
ncbi:hypothetical protein BKA62DRAFT_681807 [Auriculariales sp. MPI-PUGE-AT-0066]|nr:hypothetical protein BKA62DRAFT_681807 [Auriculariales sp. MPI-PUGE-AT-0066]